MDTSADSTTDTPSDGVVVRTRTETEAQMIVAGLAQRGIAARAVGGLLAGMRAEVPAEVSVVVAPEHQIAARDAVAAIRRETAEIDWSQVDVGRPTE